MCNCENISCALDGDPGGYGQTIEIVVNVADRGVIPHTWNWVAPTIRCRKGFAGKAFQICAVGERHRCAGGSIDGGDKGRTFPRADVHEIYSTSICCQIRKVNRLVDIVVANGIRSAWILLMEISVV